MKVRLLMAMEMSAGMPLCHTPAGMMMVRILIRTERAHLLKQKLLFLLKEWLLYMILDTFLTAGGNIPKKKTNNSLKLTTPSSNGTITSHIHDCITFWCAHNFTSWHCIIATPGMISTMHVYYLTSTSAYRLWWVVTSCVTNQPWEDVYPSKGHTVWVWIMG